jgi:hypothetical protein
LKVRKREEGRGKKEEVYKDKLFRFDDFVGRGDTGSFLAHQLGGQDLTIHYLIKGSAKRSLF